MQTFLHQGVQKGTGVDGRKGFVDARWSLLVGKFDDVGRARIKLAAMAGSLIFVGPGHRGDPDLGSAPRVVSHNDDGGGSPLVLLLKEPADVGEVAVGQSEVVDVGGVFVAKGFLAAVIETIGMGDWKVQKEEVNGRIGEVGVARGEELAVVTGVLADVAILVGGGAGSIAEEVLCVEPEIAKGAKQVDSQRAVWGKVGWVDSR